jgi:hypothetical protein
MVADTTCPNCGYTNPEDAALCRNCVFPFPQADAKSEPQSRESRKTAPMETISYYDGGFTSAGPTIGFGVAVGGVFMPIGDDSPQRSLGHVTGSIVEETSEYVIVMTHTNELVKIRPENIVQRGPAKRVAAEMKYRSTRTGIMAGFVGSLVTVILLAAGASWLVWWGFAVFGIIGFLIAAISSQVRTN